MSWERPGKRAVSGLGVRAESWSWCSAGRMERVSGVGGGEMGVFWRWGRGQSPGGAVKWSAENMGVVAASGMHSIT